MSSFQQSLADTFPGALPESDFVNRTYGLLGMHGLYKTNVIPCVAVCRDEITHSLVATIDRLWGDSFTFSGLAGMIFVGKTGFDAAHHHSPNLDGRERYVYYALPHIAIGLNGEYGLCSRPYRNGPSGACGALQALLDDYAKGGMSTGFNSSDPEQSLLKQRLAPELKAIASPTLLDVTRLAYKAILEDLEQMIGQTVDTARADYAVISGIQLHGPGVNYIWPGKMYAVVSSRRQDINLS
jgi:hypothetical protein